MKQRYINALFGMLNKLRMEYILDSEMLFLTENQISILDAVCAASKTFADSLWTIQLKDPNEHTRKFAA